MKDQFCLLLDELAELHNAKAAGYSGASNDWRANFKACERFGVPAWKGVMVRLSDKWERLVNIVADPDNERVGESVRDTLMDLASYSLIMIALLLSDTAAEEESQHTPCVKEGDKTFEGTLM